ncbi:DUF6941 family protein [Pelagicoccus albus]|uniref:Wzt C-terminal domain-containing protein n=1 Tax=Pelagicoccus albus TaxID=415222 RepID=A0A7X1B3K0_9BACT|nr:hypothetical protein [Pelagicoccus albus]MBC2604996.1 hypothetical protein [Pelagicoccus albus]
MIVEILSICDAATDYSGRLNLLGAFEGIASASAPITRESCSIAIRMRFGVLEEGKHLVAVKFVDKDDNTIGPVMNAGISVKMQKGRESGAHNLVVNLNRISFPRFGTYRIQLLVDGEWKSEIPLLVAQARARSRITGAMEN